MKNDSITRWFNLLLIAMIAVPLLTACSTVASKAASFAVSSYCQIPSGSLGRAGIRTAFNDAVYPDKVLVICSGDE